MVGLRHAVSLGVYVRNFLPRKLSIQGRELCNKPVELRSPESTLSNRDICSMAMELLYQDEAYTNYLTLDFVQISDKNKIKHFSHDCIALNSSSCLIQSNKNIL